MKPTITSRRSREPCRKALFRLPLGAGPLRQLLLWAEVAFFCLEAVSAVHSSASATVSASVAAASDEGPAISPLAGDDAATAAQREALLGPESPEVEVFSSFASSFLEDAEDSRAYLEGKSALGLRQGDSFLERFQLLEHLGSARLAVAPGFFPEVLKDEFSDETLLGHGGFGESWLAFDQNLQKQLVVKVLYIKTKDPRDTRHLTWDLAKADPHLKTAAEHAASECDLARQLHLQKDHPGSNRIMNCFGHNIPSGASTGLIQQQHQATTEPLYLMLENCGKLQLDDFLGEAAKKDSLSPHLPGRAFKQVLQGLSLLASYDPPWVHHDVKPQNLIVRSDPKDKFSVHLIDFGETVKGSVDEQCKRTASSTRYAPIDWYYRTHDCSKVANFDTSCGAHCASGFDVFAAGATFVELVSGKGLYAMKGCSRKDKKSKTRLDYDRLDGFAREPSSFVESLKPHSGYEDSLQYYSQPGTKARHFFEQIVRCLHKDPAERPSAKELLETPFMQSLLDEEALHDEPHHHHHNSGEGDGNRMELAISPQGRFSRLRERQQRSL